MALTVTRYETTEALWFVPEYMGNRKGEEPMAVKLIPAMAADLRKIEESHSVPGRNGRVNQTEFINAVVAELITKYVKEVRGLHVRNPGSDETREVKDADDLMAVAPEGLLLEIYGAIRDHSQLEAGAKKE